MQNEIWKDIPNYEGLYKCSNLGRIKSLSRIIYPKTGGSYLIEEKIKIHTVKNSGYLQTTLNKEGKYKTFRIHQLVAICFLNHKPCGFKLVVDHIDNNPLNNNLENLQLITNRENSSKDKKGFSSKYPGVSWQVYKWIARIRIKSEGGKKVHLGYFEKEYDAHLAVQKKLREIGEID